MNPRLPPRRMAALFSNLWENGKISAQAATRLSPSAPTDGFHITVITPRATAPPVQPTGDTPIPTAIKALGKPKARLGRGRYYIGLGTGTLALSVITCMWRMAGRTGVNTILTAPSTSNSNRLRRIVRSLKDWPRKGAKASLHKRQLKLVRQTLFPSRVATYSLTHCSG